MVALVTRCPTGESLRARVGQRAAAQAVLDTTPSAPGIPSRPIPLTALDLDCLWAEFSISGDAQVVQPIIGVLEWPDLIRHRLERWLRSRPGPPARLLSGRGDRASTLEGLRLTAGITCDPAGGRVETVEDLDGWCTIESLQPSSERLAAIRAALPFWLSGQDMRYLGMKMAATWSLGSHARQHPAILELCQAQVAVRTGRARLSLLGVIGAAHPAGRDPVGP